jgi:hypothetical protein
MGSSTIIYRGSMITAPGGGWTPGNVDGLTARVGYASAITGKPAWDALVAEVEYPNAPSTQPNLSVRIDGYDAGSTTPHNAPATAAFGLIAPGTAVVLESRTTVTTDAANGYSLYVHDPDSNGALYSTGASATVPWITGPTWASPGVFPGNGMGVSAFGLSTTPGKWCNNNQALCPNTGTVAELQDTDLRYAPVSSTPQLLTSGPAATAPGGETTRIPISLQIPATPASGSYRGEIMQTAVASP